MKNAARYLLWYGGAALMLALTILPLARPAWFATPLFTHAAVLWTARIALLVLPLVAAILGFRTYAASRGERIWLIILVLLAAGFAEQVHHQFVDKGAYFGGGNSNTTFQQNLQQAVLELRPDAIPHSYRFVSHSLVAWAQWLSGSFFVGRAAYRLLFNTLLFVAIFRYARLFLGKPASVGVVLAMLLVYPITVAWYAGQFVDPASHLSFVACLYFFARPFEPGVGPALVVGVLAKESVAALAVCRAFYGSKRARAVLLAGLYFGAALAALIAIRYIVNRHAFGYGRISGVGMDHVWANLSGYDEWPFQYLFSLGIFLPGAWLGWHLMDRPFRLTCLLLTAALVVSSALFSWLNEVRNLVPALVMLAIVNLKYVESRFLRSADQPR